MLDFKGHRYSGHCHFLMLSFETVNSTIQFFYFYVVLFINKVDLDLCFHMLDNDDLHLGSRRQALH